MRRRCVHPGAWCAMILLICAGCATLTAPGDPATCASCANGEAKQSTGETPSNAWAAPAPRTLPQAVCAYLHCLRCGPPPPKEEAKAGEKENGKKNPPAEKDTEPKKDAKETPDKQAEGAPKSKQATGEPKSKDEGAGQDKKKDENGKENGKE